MSSELEAEYWQDEAEVAMRKLEKLEQRISKVRQILDVLIRSTNWAGYQTAEIAARSALDALEGK